MFASSAVAIATRSITIMGFRLGLCGAVLPAVAILAVTLLEAAIHTRLQGILITGTGIALFIGAMYDPSLETRPFASDTAASARFPQVHSA